MTPKKKPATPKKSPRKEFTVKQIPPGKFGILIQESSANPQIRPRPLHVSMHPDIMKDMQIEPGDFLILVADSSCLGIAWPGNVDKNYVRISDITLWNLQAIDTVTIHKCFWPIRNALTVHVSGPKVPDSFKYYLQEVLIDLEYILESQDFTAALNGKDVNFKVTIGTHEGEFIYRINRSTKIVYMDISIKKPTVTFQDIGGLDEEVNAIREMIELPLFSPQIFLEYDIPPPKGLLLFGPPGTGKTLIAKAVAAQTNAHMVIINGPELLSSFYGETETRLKDIFEQAMQMSPSIIFIDEIDSICPRREDSDSELSRRIVATLLTLMDGAETSNGIFVIGATNRPNAIDDALRRPGRFDREFEIGVPNAPKRMAILSALLRNMNVNVTSTELEMIASKAHGYVGADLAAICREAGLSAIKRLKNLHNLNDDDLAQHKDLKDGLARVRPSLVRDIEVQVPKVYWDDIGGQEDIKQRLKEAVEWPLKHPEVFLKFNIRPPKGILLYGPPGCSKTLTAKALATEAGLNFLAVKGPELFSKWVGESEKAVQQLFKKARQAAPSIIFFDEIDALAVRRNGQDASVADRVLSQLLTEMDGVNPLVDVTIIAATNRPDILDSALLRPGRIDSILYVAPPDFDTRKSILKIQFQKMPIADDVEIDFLAEKTRGYSGAETVAICQNAAMNAMEEDVNIEKICKRHFVSALNEMSPQITTEMLNFYKEFQQRSGLRNV